jgi:hypothetical protein
VQGTPTHNWGISSPAASPGLDVLVPGRKKRKRQFGGCQPGLLGFNETTSNVADRSPYRKRARLSTDSAKPIPAPAAQNAPNRTLALLKKASFNSIGKGAPNTGPKLSEKEEQIKGLRKKGENKAAAPAKLKGIYLPPCEEPEENHAVITPTDCDNILRTVTSDNDTDATRMDIDVDMSGDPPLRGPSSTSVPQTPPPAREEPVAPRGLSQRTESTQEIINVLDFELNFFEDEDDADLQRALQLDCEMHSSPTRPTVYTPSVIELDDTVDFNPTAPKDFPLRVRYGGIPGVGSSWESHVLATDAVEAVSYRGGYHCYAGLESERAHAWHLEKPIPDPFAPYVVDLHRQTIQKQLRLWAKNPRAAVIPDLVDELVMARNELAIRVEKQLMADTTSVSCLHDKGDVEKFIELDLKPITSLSEGSCDEEDVVPESPEVESQPTPEERVVPLTQAAVASSSRVSGSGSSRLSTTPGVFAIIDSEMKASDEGVGISQTAPCASGGVHIPTTESESARQAPMAPLRCSNLTSRPTQPQSSKKGTELTDELEKALLKQLNLLPEALVPHRRALWEVSDTSTYACWISTKAHLQRLAFLRPLRVEELTREQDPDLDGSNHDFTPPKQ